MPQQFSATHNETRFRAYRTVACEFVKGEAYDPNQLANMLLDLRWNEVPRAFAVALHIAARAGPLRENLKESFRGLLSYIAFLGFGSIERQIVQPWFLQNWDFFFVATLDGLLVLNAKNSILRTRIDGFRRAVYGVFDMLDAGRLFMSLESASIESTGAHALLAACNSSRGCFINNGVVQLDAPLARSGGNDDRASRREITLAHVLLMDIAAEAILASPCRDITTWDHAFGYFVGSESWRGFARRCRIFMPHLCFTKNILKLENAVDAAHNRLQARALLEKQRLVRECHIDADSDTDADADLSATRATDFCVAIQAASEKEMDAVIVGEKRKRRSSSSSCSSSCPTTAAAAAAAAARAAEAARPPLEAARPPLQGLPLGSSAAILAHPKFRSLIFNPRVVRC